MVFTAYSSSLVELTPISYMFMVLGIVDVILASISAIFRTDAKRLLVYSSIAQINHTVLGMGFASVLALTATLVHVFHHALMKGALFMAVGALVYRVGSSRLGNFHGLGRQMPWTFSAILIAGLSLIGIPGTAGLISKWYLVLAVLEQQSWLITAVILLGSLLAVIHVRKIVEVMLLLGSQGVYSTYTQHFGWLPRCNTV